MITNKIKFNEWPRHLKNPCGFTLIEMVMVIVLLGVIGIFSTQFITSITQSAQQTTAQKGLVDDAKLAMEYLIREVRVANRIAFNSSGSSITFDKSKGYGYTEDSSTVDIIYAWNSGTQNLTRTSGTKDGGGNLLTQVGTILATQVTHFKVVESPPGSNFYVFTMTLQGPNGEDFTLESGVRPRFI